MADRDFSPGSSTDGPLSSRRRLVAGLAISLATLALMLATEPRLAIVWDEGYTLGRQARLRLWFLALEDPPRFASTWQPPVEELVQQVGAPAPRRNQVDTRAKLLLDPAVLAWFWPFAREEPHGHPPFYALLGLAGDLLTPSRPALARARLGPILIFSLTAGVLFLFVAKRYGPWPGALAAGAWVLQPNLFGHGHYATYDALLSALWLTAILAFIEAVEVRPGDPATHRSPHWGWVAIFGLLAGCAADTKLTGWFLPFPFLVWITLYQSRRGFLTLLVGGLVAAATLYLLNPPWWTEPVAGLSRFFASNLGREQTIRIKTLFLGQVFSTPDGSLPWYNTIVWTALVTPVGFLLLALTGVGRALRRWRSEPFGILVLGHWTFLLLLRALPHTPGHDGVRQFLPAFGILALLAGLGAATVMASRGFWGKRLLSVAIVEGLVGLTLMMPMPLSYYSPIVGALPGAASLGMEPTYYWDALNDDALNWLLAHTPPGRKVRFATYPTSFLYLRDSGRLPRAILPSDPGTWAWYVVQNRPGAFNPIDQALVTRGKPAFEVRKLGVPLLWIFPYEQVEAFLRTQALSPNKETKTPTPPRGHRVAVGEVQSPLKISIQTLLTRGVNLGGGLSGRVDGGRLVDNRGRRTSRGGLLVAEPAPGALVSAKLHLEAMLLRDRLANRGGRGARLGNHAGGGSGRTGFLVTSLRVGRGHKAESADKSQGEQVQSHGVVS